MKRSSGILIQVIVLVALIAVIGGLLLGPDAIANIIEAKKELTVAEGHRELDFAAAEAIRANARQVDTVTSTLSMGSMLLCLGPVFLVVLLLAFAAAAIFSQKNNDPHDIPDGVDL